MHLGISPRSPFVRAALAATALTALAGCSGGSPKTVAAGGADSTTSTTTASGAVDAAGGSTTSTGAPGTASTVKGATTTAKGATSGSTAKGATSASTAKGAPAGAASGAGSPPGTYTYDVKGSATGGTPPTTRPITATATNKVDPAVGSDQHSATTSENGGGGVELFLRFEPTQVLITELKLTGQLAKDFKPASPVLGARLPAKTGDAWSWDMTSTDGTTTIHADFSVLGSEPVTVQGKSEPATKLQQNLKIVTSYNGAPITVKIDTTSWTSPTKFVALQEHTLTDAGAFGSGDTMSTLRSLTPT